MKAVILAAGEGKRMKSVKPKVMHEILAKPILHYVLDSAKAAGIDDICLVLGHQKEIIRQSAGEEVVIVEQKEQLGTGHAVMSAGDFISGEGTVAVIFGDTPLIKAETLRGLINYHEQNGNSVTVVAATVDDPTGYGRIVQKDGRIFIVEHKDADDDEKKIKQINTGLMCFQADALRLALGKLENNNAQKEFYLTDTLEILQKEGRKCEVYQAEDAEEFLGINTRVQLYEAAEILKKRINFFHMNNGVTIIDPQNTYISPETVIGEDTVIYPNCWITGETRVGRNCVIGANCSLTDMIIEDGAEILSSTAVSSIIGKNTHVGPYAYIRPNCNIGENVRIGDFVELKNTTVGNGSKVPHLTYLGDADIGEKVNMGCGTVTVNYDGSNKSRTVVEDSCFVGCNANLIAPVKISKGAYIAAGSTITNDVPENVLAIARARQVVKANWRRK